MRKLFLMLLIGSFSLALSSCGGGSSSTSEEVDSTTMEEPAAAPMEEAAPMDSVEADSAATM